MNQINTIEDSTNLPEHLQSYDQLTQHFRANLADLSTTEKGDRFAHFASKIIPQTNVGSDYEYPEINPKKSSDEGVDLIARSKERGYQLYIQSKLWVDRASTIDSVISDFTSYYKNRHIGSEGQMPLFSDEENPPHFMLITLSPLKGILKSYKNKSLASKDTFNHWEELGRIHFIDGYEILQILGAAYRKLGEVPVNLTLKLASACIQLDNIFLGVVSSDELQSLYKKFGDSLFFENIRDFLGVAESQFGRSTPNEEIVKTAINEPGKMLERNNGIVIRADKVEITDSGKELFLSKGSVVNGCQTTMCLIQYAKETCYVTVKVVQTDQSWEITKAANFQTRVPDIDLELARVLRPQLARRAAVTAGVKLESPQSSAFQLIDEIYSNRVAYDETRLLFIGLFSRLPNNLYDSNYTELIPDLLNHFYDEDPHGQEIFDTVFLIQEALQEGTDEAQARLTHHSFVERFKRFFKPDKPAYRCFVCLLALSAVIDIDLADRNHDSALEYERMREFLSKTRIVLQKRRERFIKFYSLSVKTWMQHVWPADLSEAEGLRDMSVRSKRAPFSGMLSNLYMEVNLDDSLKIEEEAYLASKQNAS